MLVHAILLLLLFLFFSVVFSVLLFISCELVGLSGVPWQCMMPWRKRTGGLKSTYMTNECLPMEAVPYPSFIETLTAALALDCGYLNSSCLLPRVRGTQRHQGIPAPS